MVYGNGSEVFILQKVSAKRWGLERGMGEQGGKGAPAVPRVCILPDVCVCSVSTTTS